MNRHRLDATGKVILVCGSTDGLDASKRGLLAGQVEMVGKT
jgi:hypothetical protein